MTWLFTTLYQSACFLLAVVAAGVHTLCLALARGFEWLAELSGALWVGLMRMAGF